MRKGLGVGLIVLTLAGCGGKVPPSEAQFKETDERIAKSRSTMVMQYAPEYIKKAEAALQDAKTIVSAKEEDRYEYAQLLLAKAQVYPELAEKIAEVRESQSKVESSAAESKAAEARARAEIQTVVAALKRTKAIIPHLRGELEKLIKELDSIMKEFDDIEKKYPSSSSNS